MGGWEGSRDLINISHWKWEKNPNPQIQNPRVLLRIKQRGKGCRGVRHCPSCCFSTIFQVLKTQGSSTPAMAHVDGVLSHVPRTHSC